MPLLVVIAGPTAIGKTALSIKVAKEFNCPIISADSRQFYKEMNIGTAKPTIEEMGDVAHHFVDFLSIEKKYTAGQFEKDVILKLEKLFKNHSVVVLTGGSGLYIDAITKGIDPMPSNPQIKAQIIEDYNRLGLDFLVEKITALDPELSRQMDLGNPQRLIRAIEVCLSSGKKYSDLRKSKPKQRNFNMLKIALNMDRKQLYDRINNRVEIMLQQGLEKEVEGLLPFKKLNALQTVGYLELFDFFDGKITKNRAIELIKQNSRRYAKRQLTWFRKDTGYNWFLPTQIKEIMELIQQN